MKKEILCLIELRKDGIFEIFSHECPEPVYDMFRQYQEYHPTGKYEVLRKII